MKDPPPSGAPEGPAAVPARPRSGDEELESLRSRLAAAVARVCPPWLASHAEDIVQDSLLRLVEIRRSGGNREFPSSYLARTAYSVAVDEMRRRFRRREAGEVGSYWDRVQGSGATNPERRAASREIGRAITDCLASLVAPRRRAVTLHLQGYSVPETSAALAWSAKKAEHLVHRGLADLRRCLGAKGMSP